MKIIKSEHFAAFENDTAYIFEGNMYDVFLDDCTVSHDLRYLSASRAAGNELIVGFLLKNLHNVTLDFGGAKVVFHGRIAPFVFDCCENITMKNLSVIYDRPFYTQAEMLEADTKHLKLRISDGFSCRVDGTYLIATSETWENHLNTNNMLFQPFDRNTLSPKGSCIIALIGEEIFPHKPLPLPCRHLLAEEDGENVILHGEFPSDWQAGDYLAMTHETRDKHMIFALCCKGMLIENFRIIHGASFGFVGMHSSDITFDRFNMFRDQENPALVTCIADSIHCFNCSGKIIMKNCRTEGMLDDTLNIHTNYSLVRSFEPGVVHIACGGSSVSIRNTIYTEGDEAAVYRGKTQDLRGIFHVKNVTTDGAEIFHLETDDCEFVPEEGDLVENLSANPEIFIENCLIRNARARLLLQSRNKIVVRNCIFIGPGRIGLTGDATYWFEGSPVRDCTIENCFFDGEGAAITVTPEILPTQEHPYFHSGLTVRNCIFTGDTIMSARFTDKIKMDGNISLSNRQLKALLYNCGECNGEDVAIIRNADEIL